MNKKLKLSLLSTLIVGSTISMALPIISCSNSSTVKDDNRFILSSKLKENNANNINKTKDILWSYLKTKTYSLQEYSYAQWKEGQEVPLGIRNALIEIFNFENRNGVTLLGSVIVDKIIFYKVRPFPKAPGLEIKPITIKLILKPQYRVNSINERLNVIIPSVGNTNPYIMP